MCQESTRAVCVLRVVSDTLVTRNTHTARDAFLTLLCNSCTRVTLMPLSLDTATHCNTLQHTATHTLLLCTHECHECILCTRVTLMPLSLDSATHCNTLQHTLLTLQQTQRVTLMTLSRDSRHGRVLLCKSVVNTLPNTLQHTATHCNTLQHTLVQPVHTLQCSCAQEGSCATLDAATNTQTQCNTLQQIPVLLCT